jgi:FkbM family methyltransferase
MMHGTGPYTTTTDTRFGEMSYVATDFYIGKSLELYGEYSWGEIELLSKIIKPGWTIVNGGANIGALSVPLAELVPEGRVYAFEPQPEIFDILKTNAARHSNIHAYDCALWSSSGTTRMRYLNELNHQNIGGLIINDAGGTYDAPMVSLDEWLQVQGERIDLIFLDIEGCEVAALKGARATIERCRPVLYVEDHPGYDTGIGAFVRSLDYLVYAHQPLLFSPDNWKKHEANFFGNVASFNSLCIPKERLEEFRGVLDDQPRFTQDLGRAKLRLVVPKSPAQGRTGWAGIVRCGGVGDNLIAASPCKALKAMGYKVEMISQRPQSAVFENNPYIDKLSVYDAKDWSGDLMEWQAYFYRRSKEYDRFANLSHSVEAKHGLIPIQTWYWWPEEYRREMCGGSYLETAHDILRVPHDFGPLFFPTDEEKEQARVTRSMLTGKKIVAWTLGGTRIDKVYPYASLLIARLIKELGVQVVMLGAPPPHRDYEVAKTIRDHVKVQNGTLDGLTHASSLSMEDESWPIRRILTFAAECDLVIGPDTGPSWGVAFEPVPKIIMVSHASDENITKHWLNTTTLHADQGRVKCWPCHRLHDTFAYCNPININGNEFASCISDIGVEVVVSEAARLLNR